MLFKSIFAGILLVFVSSISAKECNLDISGTDMMQFDKTILELDSGCTTAKLTLKHTGALAKNIMGHNVVIVATEKFDSVIASISMDAGLDNGYLAESEDVLAKTAMIGGGEVSEIALDLSKFEKGASYTFFCSFPGHYAIMKGKFVI